MYKFCFKIEIKTKADSYMPCEAMAHSTKWISGTSVWQIMADCEIQITFYDPIFLACLVWMGLRHGFGIE